LRDRINNQHMKFCTNFEQSNPKLLEYGGSMPDIMSYRIIYRALKSEVIRNWRQ